MKRVLALILALVMLIVVIPQETMRAYAEEVSEPLSDTPVELFTSFSTTDFFLKNGTLADGKEHVVAIYSNTNNARMAVIPLLVVLQRVR